MPQLSRVTLVLCLSLFLITNPLIIDTARKMVADVVGDTISEITGRMSSLPVFGDNSISITEDIKLHLLTIKGVVAKLEQHDTTRDWLGQVTNVVTDLFYLVDDLSADAALLQKQSKIRSFFSLRNLPLLKLEEIKKQLEDVAANATRLSQKLTNSDAEDPETKIVGRKVEKEKIIKKILSEKNVLGALPVVTIVGIEGIGKTKLAKSIRDDEKVKRDFDLRIWIDCIHEHFSVECVKCMIESAKKKKLEDKSSILMDQNLNHGEALRESRFLLVLDDLRNEDRNEWLSLHHMLTEAAASTGGAVLITTQSDIVANIVKSYTSFNSYLSGLREGESLSLFEQIVERDSRNSKTTEAREKMVKMCKGVPLAILKMARLLSSREAITDSEIYQLKEKFLQEVQLRYYNKLLSWRLKQCFAYCSLIFSTQDSGVDAQTLIRLWMAEGFLGPLNSSSADLGRECIQEFRRRSIFSTHEKVAGILKNCFMKNNLMRDLSAFVARDDSMSMNYFPDKYEDTVRRVSLTFDSDVSNGIPNSLFKTNKKLRTILLPGHKHLRVPNEKLNWSAIDAFFSAFKRLRVLNLQDLGMKMLPSSIGELKSLRYLDLSRNNMKKLPNSIGELKHLQTLKLSHCHELRKLPNDVKHLMSLRHLEMEACLHLKYMPSALKNLTWLQTLSHFVASTSRKHTQTGGLGELINLNNLRGELEILHLERLKFKESEQDGHAYLKQKQHLQWLTLKWNHYDEDVESQNSGKHFHSSDFDQISLEHLEPHPNLQVLSIVGYKGKKISDWLLSLKNLVQFSLYNCSIVEFLHPLNQFPKLKILQLERLDSLKFITDQDDGCNELELPATSNPLFPSLKQLRISDCPNLISLWKRPGNNAYPSSFASISILRVQYCPNLDCMPLYPNLDKELVLECSSMKLLQDTINYRNSTSASTSRTAPESDSDSDCCCLPLSKLKKLTIVNVEEQSPLMEQWMKNFISLEELYIKHCKGFKSLMKGFKHLSSLEILGIRNCTQLYVPSNEREGLKNLRCLYIVEILGLKSLPEGIKHLASLNTLKIDRCLELSTLTEGIGDLKSLTSLEIFECPKLAFLPKEMTNLKSLNLLKIGSCPLLFPRCQKETGDDWPHIKHIKNISVKDTSA